MDAKREETNFAIQEFGALRLETDAVLLKRFVDIVAPVHNGSHKPIAVRGTAVEGDLPTFAEMKLSAYQATDLLKDGLVAVPVGVLTGMGAAGGVSALGVASTGTAIGTLSGAAATNATLAWLGGGSLAAGGWGVAGGTAVLGGVVAGPIIAVVGIAAASRMNKMATAAWQQESEYRVGTEQLENAVVVLDAIGTRIRELSQVTEALARKFEPVLRVVESLVARKMAAHADVVAGVEARRKEASQRPWLTRLIRFLTLRKDDFSFADPLDFDHFAQAEKDTYMLATSMAFSLYALLKVPVLEDDGSLSSASGDALNQAQKTVAG